MTTESAIQIMKEQDTYSIILFLLYKLMGTKEYSTLSQLAYILDRKQLVDLCDCFGGQTIKVPTLKDLKEVIELLLLYHKVNVQKQDFNECIKEVEDKEIISEKYKQVCELMQEYNFEGLLHS